MTRHRRPSAVVFDMDGTLLDTERIALRTFQETCAEYELTPYDHVYHRCIGTRGEQTRVILQQAYGARMPLDAFFEAWSNRYRINAIEQPVPVKPGVHDLLAHLRTLGIPTAVATSTQRPTALRKLTHAMLLDYFEFVLGGDDVAHGKPHPAIYLEAVNRLALKPPDVLAVEDSSTGVRSAVAAGLRVVQIPDLLQPNAEITALGHHIAESMFDVKLSYFE